MAARPLVAFLSILLVLCFLPGIDATHFAYATMQWNLTQTLTNPTSTIAFEQDYTYTMTAAFRWSFFSNPPIGNYANTGASVTFVPMFNPQPTAAQVNQYKSYAVNLLVVQTNPPDDWFYGYVNANPNLQYTVAAKTSPPFSTIGQPNYRIYYTNCCRLSSIQDGNHDLDWTITGILNTKVGRSPITTGTPRVWLALNVPSTYFIPYVSQANLPVFFFLSAAIDSTLANASPLPVTTYGPWTFNQVIGRVDWTPALTGLYAIQFMIEEICGAAYPSQTQCRMADGVTPSNNGGSQATVATQSNCCARIPLDFIFQIVVQCTSQITTNCFDPPYFYAPFDPKTDPSTWVENFYRYVQGTFMVCATHDDPTQLVEISLPPLPPNSVMNGVKLNSANRGRPACYQFLWTPGISDVDQFLCFYATAFPSQAKSIGQYCIKVHIIDAPGFVISGIIRDFHVYHTNFNRTAADWYSNSTFPNNAALSRPNWVLTKLGSDYKPAWNTAVSPVPTTVANSGFGLTNTANGWYDWWHTDDPTKAAPVNLQQILSITLSSGVDPNPYIFFYVSNFFYPIDNQLFGNEGMDHNHFYTYEVNTYLTYYSAAGSPNGLAQQFTFQMDDDFWLFVDTVLPSAWNLYGIRPAINNATSGTTYLLNMDTFVAYAVNAIPGENHTIVNGETVRCDFFYANRRNDLAPTFIISLTNFTLCDGLSSGVQIFNWPNFGATQLAGQPIPSSSLVFYPSLGGGAGAGFATCNGTNTCLQLTKSTNTNSVSSVWYTNGKANAQGVVNPTPLLLTHGFRLEGSFQINGAQTAPGAEGFAVVMVAADTSPASGAGSGFNLGYGGALPKSLAIEFDMQQSSAANDPVGYNSTWWGQVSVHTITTLNAAGAYPLNSADENVGAIPRGFGGSSDPTLPLNFINGTAQYFKIEYQPAKFDPTNPNLQGSIRVWVGQLVAPVVEALINQTAFNNMIGGAAYLGFSAGTGAGAANLFISYARLLVVPTSAAQTGANAPPFSIVAGDTGYVTIQAKDACGDLILTGGELASFTAMYQPVLCTTPFVNATGVDNNNGSYTFYYNPTVAGVYTFPITFGGQPILNSPFPFTVNPAPVDPPSSFAIFSQPPNEYSNIPSDGMACARYNSLGGYLDFQMFDLSATADVFKTLKANGMVTWLNGIGATDYLTCALAGDTLATAQRAIVAPALSAKWPGITKFASLTAGNSYAVVVQASRVSETANSNRVSISQLSGIDASSISFTRSFNVTAQSATSFCGPYARVRTVFNDTRVPAASMNQLGIEGHDRFGNLNPSNVFTAYFSPDITAAAAGGSLTYDLGLSGGGYQVYDYMNPKAGQYFFYVKINGVNVFGSQYLVTFTPGLANINTSSSAPNAAVQTAGVNASFIVSLADINLNPINFQNPLDSISAVVTLGGTTLYTVTLTWTDGSVGGVACQKCVLIGSYYPTLATTQAQLVFTINGATQVYTPVTINPGPLSAPDSNCTFAATSLPPAGLVTSLIIQAKDRFKNLRLVPNQAGDVFYISYNPAVQASTSTIGPVTSYLGVGQYQAFFTPIKKGNQQVTVVVNATGTGDVPAGTPQVCQQTTPVLPGAPDPQSTVTIPFSYLVAGTAQAFTLLSIDPFGNVRDNSVQATQVAFPTDYLYRFYAPSDPRQPEGTYSVNPNTASGTFTITLNATVAAVYQLTISTNPTTAFAVNYPSKPLKNSPFTIVVRPGPTYPPNTGFTSATGSYGGFPNNQSSFQITANDIFMNQQWDFSDQTKYNVTVYNIDGVTINNQPTLVNLAVNGTYNVTYTIPPNTLAQPKTFVIKVCHSGIPGVYSSWCTNLTGTVLPDNTVSYANITVSQGQAGFLSNFTIDNQDSTGVPVETTTSFSVTLTRTNPPDGVTISPITVTCRVTLNPDGSCPKGPSGRVYFDATFTPTINIGDFHVRVFAYGVVETQQSKTTTITATIVPGIVSPPQSKVFGLPATAAAGTSTSFQALLSDAWNHNITVANTVLANVTGPDGKVLQFTGTQSGTLYQFSTGTGLTKAGVYTAAVYETVSYANTSRLLQVTTFRITVTPGPADKTMSYAVFPPVASDGSLTTAGQTVTFVVYPLDQYGNSVTDPSTVFTYSDPLNTGATVFVPTLSTDANGVVTFKVQYTPTKIAVMPANNSVTVSLGSTLANPITGTGGGIGSPTPVSVMVDPAAVSPIYSTVSAPNNVVIAGSSLSFQITAKDIYNNFWYTNRPDSILASVAAAGASAAGATVTSQMNSSYIITVDGATGATTKASQWTGTSYAADYVWTVNAELATLAVPAFTVQNGPAAGAQSVHQDLVPMRVGTPQIYSIVTYDQYGNRCYLSSGTDVFTFAWLIGTIDCGTQEVTPIDATSNFTINSGPTYTSAGQYNYSLTGKVVGRYTLNFTTNGTPLDCIQKLVQVVQPGFACPPNSTWNIDQISVVAGTPVRIDIQVNDCFRNAIGVGGTPIAIGNTVGGSPVLSWSQIDYTTNNPPNFALPNISSALVLSSVQLQSRHHLFTTFSTPPPTTGTERDYGTSAYTFVITPYQAGNFATVISFQNQAGQWQSVPPNVTNWPNLNTNLQVTAGPPRQFAPYQPPVFSPPITAAIPTMFDLYVMDAYGNRNYTNFHTYQVTLTALSVGQGYQVPITVQPGTNGQNEFDLMSAWNGLFALKITMNPNDGSPPVVGDTVLLNISHATCAYDHPTMPYRCPDQSCVADYSQCSGLSSADRACTGVYCQLPSGSLGCAQNVQSCGCGSSMTMCPDGHCASSCPPFQSTCPSGYVACMANNAPTGACRLSAADCPSTGVCPPGLVVCPNGVACATSVAACPAMPTCTTGAQCASGLCVTSLADCPTMTSCGAGMVLCLTDYSCQTDRTKCPQQYDCYGTTSYRCPGGACRNSSAQCPSLITCPLNWVKCQGTRCAQTVASCPDMTNQTCALNQTRCPLDGACTNNLLFCPSSPTCPPSNPVECYDGSCATSVLNCPQATPTTAACGTYVGQTLVNCPDGSCAASMAQCPTGATCPGATPVLCGDGSCTTDSSNCPILPTCPANAPVRCPDGLSCRGSLPDCPTQVACSQGSIKCSDGTCALALDTCVPAASCPNGTLHCPGGECVVAYALCPTHVTCPIGYAKCSDGTCQATCPFVPSVCPSGQVVCPQASAGVQCEANVAQCPAAFVCPSSLPIRCTDSSCAVTVANCPSNLQPPPADKFPCADGTWASSQAACPTPITCPSTSPYKCFDNTCRQNSGDCPIPAACPNGEFLCSNGACVSPPWDTACIVSASQCPTATPFQCLNSTCVATSTGCDASDPLTTGSGSICPKGFVQCQAGNCVKQASASTDCVQASCPQSFGMCDSGLCVANTTTDCPVANGCPPATPVRCTYTGACMTAAQLGSGQCVVPPACPRAGVPSTYTQTCASDGSCQLPTSSCPLVNGCPSATPIRCLDGSCAVDGPLYSAGTCTDPTSSHNRCPTATPYQCDNGFCATSFTACPFQTITTGCTSTSPFMCADGSCVASSVACPLVVPCNFTVVNGYPLQQRCGDGTCRPYGTCPTVNTCAPNVRCDSGMCAPAQSYCSLNYTTGCLTSQPYKCPSGECAADSSSCSVLPQANGCSASAPVKCYDGSCQNSSTYCNFANGCPNGSPIRCNNDGSCRATVTACNGLPMCTQTICPDGSCAAASACTSFNGCPVLTPIRCADGSCAANAAGLSGGCPLTVVCNSGQFLCADGVCRATSSLCPAVAPCTNGTTRCGFSCAATCNSTGIAQCPPGTPVLCTSGACVGSSSQCTSPTGGPKNQLCSTSDATVIQCSDGGCGTTTTCIQKSNNAHSGSSVNQASAEASSGCSGTNNFMCANGLCVPADQFWRCPIIARCANGLYRCDNGSCATTCGPKMPTCTGSPLVKRCEDGWCRSICTEYFNDKTCRSVCLPYDGCGLKYPYHCANRECAANPGGCVSAAQKPQQFYRRLLQKTNIFNSSLTPCVASDCLATLKAQQSDITVDITANTNVDIVFNAGLTPVLSLGIPSGAFVLTSNTSTTTTLSVRAVAESDMRYAINEVQASRRFAYGSFLPFSSTVLSPAFSCVTGSDVDHFNVPMVVTAWIDLEIFGASLSQQPTADQYADVCLAYLYVLPGFQAWRCIVENATARTSGESAYVHPPVLTSAQYVRGTIDSCTPQTIGGIQQLGDGIPYAFILAPRAINPEAPAGLDVVQRNIVWIILGVLLGIAALVLLAYCAFRLFRYRGKYHKERDEADRLQEEVDNMKQFGGEAGNKDDAVAMTSNPLSVQLKDVQKQYDAEELKLKQAENDLRSQEGEIRQEHIKGMRDNRDKLADELDRLKRQLAEQQASGGPKATFNDDETSADVGTGETPVREEFSAPTTSKPKRKNI